MPGDQSTLHPQSHAASEIASLWWIMFAGSVVVVAVVAMLLAVALLRSRAQRGLPARDQPRWVRRGVLVLGGAIPLVVLVALFALVVDTLPAVSAPRGKAELTVAVIGHQYWWEVRYPGRRVETANEIHVPARTRVALQVSTADVIHSFWVPRLNRKIDMVPGRVNTILLRADEPGTYRGQCAEFCGLQHANMALLVVADERDRFDAWLRGEQRPARRDAAGERLFAEYGCSGCHTISGTDARGQLGPSLTHVASRRTIAANTLPNTRESLRAWIRDAQHVKPGSKMPAIAVPDGDLERLVDYVESLR